MYIPNLNIIIDIFHAVITSASYNLLLYYYFFNKKIRVKYVYVRMRKNKKAVIMLFIV